MTGNVAVIIPFYKETLSPYEEISFRQCVEVLGGYPLIGIKPASLEAGVLKGALSEALEAASGSPGAPTGGLKLEKALSRMLSFDDDYFRDTRGYSRLMLSEDFYGAFLGRFRYILIHQLDAFVFRDELQQWCAKGYDYIGAPWLRKDYPDFVKATKSILINRFDILFNRKLPGSNIPSYAQFENHVGNGGFSLRNVAKLYAICKTEKELIGHYNANSAHHHFNEDAFWSIEVNRYRKRLRKPGYRTALRFSFENLPEKGLRITKGKLPFGCHAWDLHTDFWRPWFSEAGYVI